MAKQHKMMRRAKWRQGLRDMVDWINLPDGRILEVGTYAGQSAEIFAQKFRKVICVDPFRPYESKTESEMLSAYGAFRCRMQTYPNIVHIRGFSRSSSRIFDDGELDVVYLDGNHSFVNVRDDVFHWLPKIRVGGVLCGHDYGQPKGSVKPVIDRFLGEPDALFKDSSFAFRLVAEWQNQFPKVLEGRKQQKAPTFI